MRTSQDPSGNCVRSRKSSPCLLGALVSDSPAAFRAIVSPLVTWIWIGGAIAVFGALLAAWPSPEARLRRVRSLYAASGNSPGEGGPPQ